MFNQTGIRYRAIIILTVLLGMFLLPDCRHCLYAKDGVTMAEIIPFIRKGDYNQAISLLKRYNSQSADRVDGFILLGRAYLAIGGYNNVDMAEKAFLEGLKRQPKNIVLLQYLADIKKSLDSPAQAQRYLERVSEVDPTNPEILDKLLENYSKMNDREGLQKLEVRISDWIKAHPDSMRGYMSLGKLYLGLNKPQKALEILQEGAKKNILYPPIQKVLSEAYLLTGNFALFTESYLFWLANDTTDSKTLQEEFQYAELAMSDKEAAEFREVALSQKGKYLADYWRARDPNPISIENERLMEYYRRVAYSKAYFRSGQSTYGFDDRGKVYVRWGPPEEKYADAMPTLSPELNSNYAIARNQNLESAFQERVMPIFSPNQQTMSVRGNESWYYPSIDYYLAFDFVSYGGYYREVRSLADAIVGGGTDEAASLTEGQSSADNYGDMWNMQELYRQRSHLGGIYASLAQRSVDSFAKDLTMAVPSEKMQAHRTKTPRFEVNLDIPSLNFEIRPVQFRGDSGKTKVDVLYGLKLDQLIQSNKIKDDTVFAFGFRNDIVFFDSMKQRVLHRLTRQQRQYPKNTDLTRITFTSENVGEVFPGNYLMAFQLLETSRKKGNFSKQNLRVRDFLGKDLMISDLKLSPKIQILGVDEKSGRENLWVMPYPYAQASKTTPIFLYFEVYNLALAPDRKSQFEVSLKIERRIKKDEYATELLRSFGQIFTGGKPRAIETSYQRQGNDETALEYIALDLSALNTGHARLTVTVNDLNTKKKVDNNIEFDIEK